MFLPPRENPWIHGVTRVLLPTVADRVASLRGVQVEPDDFARLQELQGPAILAPNHPTGNDPIVMIWLAQRAGRRFHYLAAREALVGPKGWLLNQLGAYSVIRGVADRESLRFTRRLLAEEERQVVIFPEGEIYEHNDKLLSFQSGVAQIGFWALDDREKAGRQGPLPVLPLAIKYRCSQDPRPIIESGLAQLERALKLAPDPALGPYPRLRRIGGRVLESLERDARLKPKPEDDFDTRIQALRGVLLSQVAHALATEVDERQAPQEQLHALFAELRAWVGQPEEDAGEYDLRRYQARVQKAAPLFQQLQRLQSWIAVSDGYVAQEATAERFLDVMGRLETEVFGEVRHRVPREAMVRIAPPIRLDERYEDYRRAKRPTVAAVTAEMEQCIRTMLRELSRRSTPFAVEE